MRGQAIKPGFKQADMGTISDNWPDRNFGDLYAEPSRNGIYKTSGFHGRGTRIVNMGEMFGFEFIGDQEMNRVALTSHELSSGGLIDGDLLFGRRSVVPAGAGKCALVVSPSEPLTFESSIIRVRLDKGKSEPRFYYYFFASPAGRSIISTIIAGTNVKGIRATELKELWVPTPSKAEQEAIAAALGDADALIDALAHLLTKKRNLKQGAMQDLLTGKKRLPGFQGDWESREIQAIAAVDPESVSGDTRRDYEFKYIALEDVDRGTLRSWTEQILATAPSRARRKIRSGDIIFATVRPNLQSHCLIDSDLNDLICSTGFSVIRSYPGTAVPQFIFAQLFAPFITRQIETLVAGSNYPAISSKDVKCLQVPLPPTFSEQSAIAAILSDIDAEIATLEHKLQKARAVKQGMMQELVTGRTRLL
jgi:type I restriction enzyme S subunit